MPQDALVLSHLGLGDNILLIGAVRFIASSFNKVYVVCKKNNADNMRILFEDNPNIILYIVNKDNDISPNYGCSMSKFIENTKNLTVFLSGGHCLNRRPYSYKFIPFNFYIDMKIDPMHFWNSFSINIPIESKNLYNSLNEIPYIFIHNNCSSGKVFDIEEVENKLNFNKDEILIINPCINVYNADHPYFNIAEKFINLKVPYYIDTIINASKIILTDSCFWCLSINLPIISNECYVYSRDDVNHDYIYNIKAFHPPSSKQIFKSITP